jgi:hypothetical protein
VIKLNTHQLVGLPINSVFQELDISSMPIYIKVGNCGGKYKDKDIRVISLQEHDGPSRLGLFEMDECTRNSKRWQWFTEEQINTFIGRLMLATPAKSEAAK